MKAIKFILKVALACFLCLCLFACDKETEKTSNETSIKGQGEIVTDTEKEPLAKIDILKVGKADCIVIDAGGKVIMIDTAEEENLAQIHAHMQRKGYEKIDMLILTHYDKDHIGGASEIISTYDVKTVVESAFESTNEWYIDYHNAMEEKSITPLKLRNDYSFTYGSCDFRILAPKKDKYSSKEDNNSSLVISMKVGERSFLFCGDAMEIRLAELVSDKIGHYDFVKLPHHGSYLANYGVFLNEVTPKYGAITCSKKNPADEKALELFAQYGMEIYETLNGIIEVTTDGKVITIAQ